MLAERFGYTVDEICELTIDSALILLSEGKDPTRKSVTIAPGESVQQAMRKLKS